MENLFWSELKQLFTYSPIHLFTLWKYKRKMENLFWSELKQLFTYSPIHLFSPPNCLEIKTENGKLVLVGVKTTIHLFTYSLFSATPNVLRKVPKISIQNETLWFYGSDEEDV